MIDTTTTAPAAEKPVTPAAPSPAEVATPAPATGVLDIEDDEAPEAEDTEAAADDGEPPDLSAYTYEPPEGAELAPDAQGRIDAYAEFAANSGIAPEQFNASLEFYNGLVAEHQAKLVEADKTHQKQRRDVLSKQWGADYKANFEIARQGEGLLPESLRVALKDARTPDGRRVALMPEFVHLLHQLGKRTGVEFDDPAADEKRLGELNADMKYDFDDYIRRGKDKQVTSLLSRKTARETAVTPGPLPGDEKREAAILKVLKGNYHKYYAEHLDKELAQIRQRRGTQ